MKVIMNQNVPKVGYKNEAVEVADGYATNFLIPRGLAMRATGELLEQTAAQQAEFAKKDEAQRAALKEQLATLGEVRVELVAPANEQGHLFRGVHAEEVAEALAKQTGIPFTYEHITLGEPIKEVGEHEIAVSVEEEKGAFTFVVVSG